jgi:hypothetical protein
LVFEVIDEGGVIVMVYIFKNMVVGVGV